jgi:hypothetical protein
MSFIFAHILLASLAVIAAGKRDYLREIAGAYLCCVIALNVFLSIGLGGGENMAWDWYVWLAVADAVVLVAMLGQWHPAAAYIGWLSSCAIIAHVLAALAWVDYDVFIPFKHAHGSVMQIIELMQVVSLFVFSLPAFRHCEKPHNEEQMTWQAMSAHQ